MFYPVSYTAKLFRKYLLSRSHPSKIRIQNFIGKYLFYNGIVVKDEYNCIFKLSPNDWISRMILIDNGYEHSSLKLVKDILKNGGAFIDIGANFGLYTCAVSENKTVKVYAVEPNYMVVPQLMNNVQLNKRNNITILNTALSDRFQFASFNLPHPQNLGSASFNTGNKSPFSVLSCSLNFIFQSQGIQQAELIKIDIEGNEFEVLKDFSFDIYPVKNILLEFNDLSGQSFEKLNNFFTEKGFLVKDINGQQLNSRITHVPENNLWLVNTNYL